MLLDLQKFDCVERDCAQRFGHGKYLCTPVGSIFGGLLLSLQRLLNFEATRLLNAST